MKYQNRSGRCCIAGLLLFISISICYANTMHVDWQFDDFQNILINPGVQLSDFTFNHLKDAFYAAPDTDKLSRPLAYLTFAVNWFFSGDKVVWYHIVNTGIHFFSALFLFMLILNMLQAPNVSSLYNSEERYFIALFSVFIWSVNPIQTQAVTYIVQRMAELAGMFYVLSMLCYVRGRITGRGMVRALYFFLCCLFCVLAVLSKQNAVTLPVALLILEFLFFRNISDRSVQRKALIIILGSGMLIGGIGFYYFFGNNVHNFLNGYQIRPYTLIQRLMTEFRVMIFYLSQIFYPVPTRLSIEHMYPVSTSLVDPWTTLLCLSAIVSLCCVSVYSASRAPFLSFSILFYFLNHLVESTVIPLELVYEHRNYIPSMFVFVPVAIGVLCALKYYEIRNMTMRRFMISMLTLFLILLGVSTHVRNMAWQSQKTMWEDVMEKAPGSPRSYHNLAWGYYERRGDYDKAISYYKKAALLPHINLPNAAQPYYCIGNIYSKMGDVDTALEFYRKAVAICGDYALARYRIAFNLTIKGRFAEAEKLLDPLLHADPSNVSYIWLKGVLCMDTQRLDQAVSEFRRCLKLQSGGWKNYFYLGVVFNLKRNYDRGFWFLRRADALQPQNAMIKLSLIQNRFSCGKKAEAARYAGEFFNIVGPESVQKFFNKLACNGFHIPFGFENLRGFLVSEMIKHGNKIIAGAETLAIQTDKPAGRDEKE